MTFASRLACRARRGAALFDVLLAVGIAGVVIVGAILLYQSVTGSWARSELVQLSRELRGAAERIYTGYADYDGLSLARLCQAGAVPEANMTPPSNPNTPCQTTRFTTPLSALQTADSLAAWPLIPASATTAKAFQIGFAALDAAACTALLSGYAGKTTNRSGFVGADVRGAGANGTANWSARTWGQFTAAPLGQADIDSLCSRPDGRNTVFLAFR